MRNIVIIAGKEIREGLRNRWVLATTLLLAALSLSLTFLGSAPTGNVGAGALDVVVVSLSSLTIFLLPLIALLISHDAVVGEMERGTMIAAAQLSRRPPSGHPRKILRTCSDPRLRHRHRLWRGGGRPCRHRRLGAGGKLVCLRVHARNLDHARRGLCRDRISDQQPGRAIAAPRRASRSASGC